MALRSYWLESNPAVMVATIICIVYSVVLVKAPKPILVFISIPVLLLPTARKCILQPSMDPILLKYLMS